MLRSLSLTILIFAAAVLLCLLALRLVVTTLYTLSGIRRLAAREQVLRW
jgi:hypothetical protein